LICCVERGSRSPARVRVRVSASMVLICSAARRMRAAGASWVSVQTDALGVDKPRHGYGMGLSCWIAALQQSSWPTTS